MSFVIRVCNGTGTIGWVGRTNDRGPRIIGSWRDADSFRTRNDAHNVAGQMPARFKGLYVQYLVEMGASMPKATLIDALGDIVRLRLQETQSETKGPKECMDDNLATVAKRCMQLHEELNALASLTARFEAKLNELQVAPFSETRQIKLLLSRAIECLGRFPRRSATAETTVCESL